MSRLSVGDKVVYTGAYDMQLDLYKGDIGIIMADFSFFPEDDTVSVHFLKWGHTHERNWTRGVGAHIIDGKEALYIEAEELKLCMHCMFGKGGMI